MQDQPFNFEELAAQLGLDLTKPNVARCYDAAFGGQFNSAVDRAVEVRGRELFPNLNLFARMARDYYLHISDEIARLDATIHHFIDLGSGLPTQGALHERLPATAQVLYNDHDPEVITLSRYIIGDNPNLRYVQCKIEETDAILGAAEEFFGQERCVCITMLGVAYFIDDATLTRIIQQFYDWSAPDSRLAVSFFDTNEHDPAWAEVVETYKKMGVDLYPRSPEQMLRLLGGWQPDDDGIQPIEVFVERRLNRTLVDPAMRGKIGFAGIFRRP